MADKKISELDQVLQINNDAAFPMSQDSGGTPTTYKATITQIGAEIGEEQTFSNLQTTSKNLVGAINELNQGGGGGGSSNANLAPDYDATSTYAVGDWCIYNGTLYQCNTAIPVAEAFDPTHWTAKKVVDELDDKVDTSDFLATNLPIQSGSATNTKDYIDTEKVANTASYLYQPTVTIPTLSIGTNHNDRTFYYKHGTRVCLSIGVRDLSVGLINQDIFFLPVGYRPRNSITVNICGYSFDKRGSMMITNAGLVRVAYTEDQGAFGYVEFDAYS